MKNRSTFKMSDDQHEHFHNLMFLLTQLAEPKYSKGAEEHGTNIWDMTDEELELAELEEIIDLAVYRLTRILKRRAEKLDIQ